jgi:putative phosphoesterase
MQYVFVSDTHGDRGILLDIFGKYATSATQIFYNGDSELDAEDSVFDGISTVRGNMDFDPKFANEQLYQDEAVTILQVHGHLVGVNMSLSKLEALAEQTGANIAIFGHTHQLGVEMINDILFLNPGSISQPRGQFNRLGGTYAVVEASDTEFQVQYYNRNLEPVEELKFTFKR